MEQTQSGVFFQFPAVLNKNAGRWTALQVSVLSAIGAVAGFFSINVAVIVIAGFLMIDFALRSVFGPRYSPLARAGQAIFRFSRSRFGVAEKPSSVRPARFAWFCGFTFSSLAVAFIAAQLPVAAVAAIATLAVFSGLEAGLGFCVACYLFGWAEYFGLVSPDACVDCHRS